MEIVAELGLLHDGSLGNCLAMIDACIDAGVDAVKLQCHQGNPVSEFRSNTYYPQDKTRADFWKRTSFTREQWELIRDHLFACRVRDNRFVDFIVSAFSIEAIEMLDEFVDRWKVPSGLVTDDAYLRRLAKCDEPVILSSGMSTWEELRNASMILNRTDLTVLQCSSVYPCPPEKVGLDIMHRLVNVGAIKVGLSDHSGTIWPGICAAYERADMLEVHVTWDRRGFGSDQCAALEIDELRQLVEGVRFVERMKPVDKNEMAGELTEMRRIFAGIKT